MDRCNWEFPPMHGGSLEIILIVPLRMQLIRLLSHLIPLVFIISIVFCLVWPMREERVYGRGLSPRLTCSAVKSLILVGFTQPIHSSLNRNENTHFSWGKIYRIWMRCWTANNRLLKFPAEPTMLEPRLDAVQIH